MGRRSWIRLMLGVPKWMRTPRPQRNRCRVCGKDTPKGWRFLRDVCREHYSFSSWTPPVRRAFYAAQRNNKRRRGDQIAPAFHVEPYVQERKRDVFRGEPRRRNDNRRERGRRLR